MAQIFLYDTTLRDGTQREDISLSVEDKLTIARRLGDFGIHYIECGWPGSNPKDADFFARANRMNLGRTRLAAFGSTRRKDTQCAADANLKALVDAGTPVVTLVGKSWTSRHPCARRDAGREPRHDPRQRGLPEEHGT